MSPSKSEPERTALVLMDLHEVVVETFGTAGRQAVHAASQALEHARQRRLGIFHVLPHYRPGYPELPSGQPFDDVKAAGLFCETSITAGIPALLCPRRDEPVVAKCRYSPFHATDLLNLLRMRDAHTLVLAGIATSGVVLSALRDAWDLGYRIVLLADACADNDAEVHRVLLEKIFPRQATVSTVAQWIASGHTG